MERVEHVRNCQHGYAPVAEALQFIGGGPLADHERGSLPVSGIAQEPVAIGPLAGQRKEGIAILDATRVDRAATYGLAAVHEHLGADRGSE